MRLIYGAHSHTRLLIPSAKDHVNKSGYNISHCGEVVVRVGAKQPVHWYLGGRVAIVQQGANVWVGPPS